MPCKVFVLLMISAVILIFVLAMRVFPSSAIAKHHYHSWTAAHTK